MATKILIAFLQTVMKNDCLIKTKWALNTVCCVDHAVIVTMSVLNLLKPVPAPCKNCQDAGFYQFHHPTANCVRINFLDKKKKEMDN